MSPARVRALPIAGLLWLAGISAPAREAGLLDDVIRVFSAEVRKLDARETEIRQQLDGLPPVPQVRQSERLGYHSALAGTPSKAKWVQVDLGEVMPIDAVVLAPAHAAFREHAGPGYGFPPRFRVEVAEDAGFLRAETVADHTDADVANPGDAPFLIHTRGVRGRFVRMTATKVWASKGRAVLALGELFVLSVGRNVAAGRPVTALDSIETPPAWSRENLVDFQSVLGPPTSAVESTTNGYHSAIENRPDAVKWVRIDLGQAVPIEEIWLLSAHPADYADRVGFGFPLRFRVEAANDPDFAQSTVLLDHTEADLPGPGDNPVIVQGHGKAARFVQITATRLWERSGDYIFALGEAQVFSGGRNLAAGASVSALDSIETGRWGRHFLVDGSNSANQLAPLSAWLEQLSRRREFGEQLGTIHAAQTEEIGRQWRWLTKLLATAGIAAVFLIGGLLWRARRLRGREVARLRARIASDLHDEIGSNLGSIALLSQLAENEAGRDEQTRGELREIRQIAEQTAESMRDIVWLLRPGDAGDLVARLRETCERMLAGTEWSFSVPETPMPAFSLEFKREVFLFFKEASSNIRRHAHARRVTITLVRTAETFLLSIADDGTGFDPGKSGAGTGMKNLAQRAVALRGDLQITSAPGQGTILVLTAPLA